MHAVPNNTFWTLRSTSHFTSLDLGQVMTHTILSDTTNVLLVHRHVKFSLAGPSYCWAILFNVVECLFIFALLSLIPVVVLSRLSFYRVFPEWKHRDIKPIHCQV